MRRQEESGLSARAFCVREMINTTSFYRWRGRLHKEGIGRSTKRKCEGGEFIEVGRIGVQDSMMTSGVVYPMEVKLDFGDGFTLTVRRG